MLNFLHKTLCSTESLLSFGTCYCFSRRFLCSTSHKDPFIVTYLVESCGLSRSSALIASKAILEVKKPDSPDRVLAFLRSHGFSNSQISKTVRNYSSVLVHNPERSLLPKFEFFYSKGISREDFAYIISTCPRLLGRSLEKCIIPYFSFYRNLFESDDKVVESLKRHCWFIWSNPEENLVPIMDVLRHNGIPDSNFVKMFQKSPRLIVTKHDTLKNNIEKVKEMGFDPQSMRFMQALRLVTGLGKDTWEGKVNVYEKWGWTRETLMSAFFKCPSCMIPSENRIEAVMKHFVNKLGCESLLLLKNPVVFTLSLERRIIPRTLVLEFLRDKQLLSKESSWTSPLILREELFLQRFIHRYEKEASELLKIYNERLNLPAPNEDI